MDLQCVLVGLQLYAGAAAHAIANIVDERARCHSYIDDIVADVKACPFGDIQSTRISMNNTRCHSKHSPAVDVNSSALHAMGVRNTPLERVQHVISFTCCSAGVLWATQLATGHFGCGSSGCS